MFAAQIVAGYSLVQIVIIAIGVVVIRQMGVAIPGWVAQIGWIVVIAVVGIFAIKVLELKVSEDAENSRIELLERESVARLKIQRAEAVARIKIQRDNEAANKDSLTAQIKQLEATLLEKRKEWHDQADRQNGMLDKVRLDLWQAQLRVAKLEGQLGVTDKTHSEAINSNGENIKAIAENTGTDLPAPTPHVEPIMPDPDPESDADDEINPFFTP